MKNIHIGQLIKEVLGKQPISVVEFARRLCKDRSSVYYMFDRKSIDTETLLRVSEILKYDFFKAFSEEENE
jgi:hypothetical protein